VRGLPASIRHANPRLVIAAVVLVAALGARIGFDEATSYRPINDAGSYLKLATEIVDTGTYSSSHKESGAGGSRGPSAYFPPGYPYFLAAVDLVDGRRGVRSAASSARLVQSVLGVASVALIGLVAFELFGSTVALIAMALAAAYPVLIEMSGTLTAENLLIALVLGAVYAVLRARRARPGRPFYAWVAAAGVLTGLAALTHENGVLVVIPLGLAVWLGRPRFSRAALAAPALLVAMAAITIAPWTVRNAVALHHFIPVTDETGITLVGTYNAASAADRPVPYKWRLYYGIPAERARVRQARFLSEPELDSRLRSDAFNYIGDHPLSPFVVAWNNTLRLLELHGSFAWRKGAIAIGLTPGTAQVGVICFWILAALALVGAFTRAARRAPRWLWVVPGLLALSVILVNVETPRFRAPVDPFLILLAALAIGAAARRLRSDHAAAGPQSTTEVSSLDVARSGG
jgi:4-amino-4-deoxy-L-arabinose transferase-like glycosyltransferase